MKQQPVAAAGMPPIGQGEPSLSFFEFWPAWLFYAPVWIWIVLLMLWHRSIRLPLLANPTLPAGGLVGEEKSRLFARLGSTGSGCLPAWILVSPSDKPADVVRSLEDAGLAFPLVAKPDIGCRGAGVRPIRNGDDLVRYRSEFPDICNFILQRMVDVEGEAGVFFVRAPGERRGTIISLTLKYFPHVVGNGTATLRELILGDPRAGRVPHLYLDRFAEELDLVLPAGEARRLVFSGSHSKGAIFRNGNAWITQAMCARFNAIADEIGEFHFGRFDVRFADFEAFRRGDDFSIIEYNGAGAEATHIWDARTRLIDAWHTLCVQFLILFRLGAANARRGYRPMTFREFFRQWRREKSLVRRYPSTQ